MAVADERQNDCGVAPDELTFSIRGGAWVGWWSVTWPLARLSGDSNALRLSYFGPSWIRRDYVFHRSSIQSLSRLRLIGVGLRIEHTVPTYPKYVVFWVPRPGKNFVMLKDTLERLGYLN